MTDSVIGREHWNEGDRKIEAVITDTRRYEHVLGTHEVRIIDPLAAPARETVPKAP
jgi:hypothetical protein